MESSSKPSSTWPVPIPPEPLYGTAESQMAHWQTSDGQKWSSQGVAEAHQLIIGKKIEQALYAAYPKLVIDSVTGDISAVPEQDNSMLLMKPEAVYGKSHLQKVHEQIEQLKAKTAEALKLPPHMIGVDLGKPGGDYSAVVVASKQAGKAVSYGDIATSGGSDKNDSMPYVKAKSTHQKVAPDEFNPQYKVLQYFTAAGETFAPGEVFTFQHAKQQGWAESLDPLIKNKKIEMVVDYPHMVDALDEDGLSCMRWKCSDGTEWDDKGGADAHQDELEMNPDAGADLTTPAAQLAEYEHGIDLAKSAAKFTPEELKLKGKGKVYVAIDKVSYKPADGTPVWEFVQGQVLDAVKLGAAQMLAELAAKGLIAEITPFKCKTCGHAEWKWHQSKNDPIAATGLFCNCNGAECPDTDIQLPMKALQSIAQAKQALAHQNEKIKNFAANYGMSTKKMSSVDGLKIEALKDQLKPFVQWTPIPFAPPAPDYESMPKIGFSFDLWLAGYRGHSVDGLVAWTEYTLDEGPEDGSWEWLRLVETLRKMGDARVGLSISCTPTHGKQKNGEFMGYAHKALEWAAEFIPDLAPDS